jgi:hypothetical protein
MGMMKRLAEQVSIEMGLRGEITDAVLAEADRRLKLRERTRRAREIARTLRLGYMECAGEYHPDAEEFPFEVEVERFLVFNMTDGGDDGWVDFDEDWDAVVARIRSFVFDEWGFCDVFDLDRDDYATPLILEIDVTVRVLDDPPATQGEATPEGAMPAPRGEWKQFSCPKCGHRLGEGYEADHPGLYDECRPDEEED